MQERRILNGLIDLNSIPSSAIEITTANITSTLGNVFYIPMYVCLYIGGPTVEFYILHIYGTPVGTLLSINNFPFGGYFSTEDVGNSIGNLSFSGANYAIMFSLPETYAKYTYSTPAYKYYYTLYTKFNIYTSYDTFTEGSLSGFKSMVSEIIEEPDFKPYAVVKLSGQYQLLWVDGQSSVKSAYLKYPPIYIDNE